MIAQRFNLKVVALALLGMLPLLGGLDRVAVVCTGADGQTHLDVAHGSGQCVEHKVEPSHQTASCDGHGHTHPHPDSTPTEEPDPCEDQVIDFDITQMAGQDHLDFTGCDLLLFTFDWPCLKVVCVESLGANSCPRILGPPGPEPCLLKTSRFLI